MQAQVQARQQTQQQAMLAQQAQQQAHLSQLRQQPYRPTPTPTPVPMAVDSKPSLRINPNAIAGPSTAAAVKREPIAPIHIPGNLNAKVKHEHKIGHVKREASVGSSQHGRSSLGPPDTDPYVTDGDEDSDEDVEMQETHEVMVARLRAQMRMADPTEYDPRQLTCLL